MAQMHIVTPDEFAGKSWKRIENYAFASKHNLVPVIAGEIARLACQLPLAFIRQGERFLLVAVTSLQPDRNYFVLPDGRWLGDYVPVELRSHPFKMLKPEQHPKKVLCVDKDSALLGNTGEGEAFFDAEGKPSQALQDMVKFLSEADRNREATQTAVDALAEAGLIDSWELSLNQEGKTIPVKGLYKVNEQALQALPDEDWIRLRHSSAAPIAYTQLISMNQIPRLQQAINLQANWNKQGAASG